MKITKSKLKQIIKEELERVLENEGPCAGSIFTQAAHPAQVMHCIQTADAKVRSNLLDKLSSAAAGREPKWMGEEDAQGTLMNLRKQWAPSFKPQPGGDAFDDIAQAIKREVLK